MARLAGDARLGLGRDDLAALLSEPLSFVGAAPRQVAAFVREVEAIAARHPDAAVPEPIL